MGDRMAELELAQQDNSFRLAASIHAAQATGALRDPEAVRNLLAGIADALTHSVEGNARDPESAWALHSQIYWDHFEMDIKEALLGAFAGTPPALSVAVREVVEQTLNALKRSYRYC